MFYLLRVFSSFFIVLPVSMMSSTIKTFFPRRLSRSWKMSHWDKFYKFSGCVCGISSTCWQKWPVLRVDATKARASRSRFARVCNTFWEKMQQSRRTATRCNKLCRWVDRCRQVDQIWCLETDKESLHLSFEHWWITDEGDADADNDNDNDPTDGDVETANL